MLRTASEDVHFALSLTNNFPVRIHKEPCYNTAISSSAEPAENAENEFCPCEDSLPMDDLFPENCESQCEMSNAAMSSHSGYQVDTQDTTNTEKAMIYYIMDQITPEPKQYEKTNGDKYGLTNDQKNQTDKVEDKDLINSAIANDIQEENKSDKKTNGGKLVQGEEQLKQEEMDLIKRNAYLEGYNRAKREEKEFYLKAFKMKDMDDFYRTFAGFDAIK